MASQTKRHPVTGVKLDESETSADTATPSADTADTATPSADTADTATPPVAPAAAEVAPGMQEPPMPPGVVEAAARQEVPDQPETADGQPIAPILPLTAQQILNRDMMKAVESKNYDETLKLLDEGRDDMKAEVNAPFDDKNGRGYRAIQFATVLGQEKILNLLLERKADPDAPGLYDLTALHFAAEYGQELMMELLVKAKGNVNAQNEDGQSVLQLACKKGKINTVKLLLENGVRVNDKSNDGDTALHRAAFWFKPEIINLLKEHGASLTEKNNNGQTPYDVAEKRREMFPGARDKEMMEGIKKLLETSGSTPAPATE